MEFLNRSAKPPNFAKSFSKNVFNNINFYFSKKKRITAQVSYLNIFNLTFNYDETKKPDFGSLHVGVGIKLF